MDSLTALNYFRHLGIVLFVVFAVSLGSTAMAEPMKFLEEASGGNCEGCLWISAQGEITADTPRQFLNFWMQRGRTHSHLIRIHSPGGNLFASLQLGELFQEIGVRTEIAQTDSGKYASWGPGVCDSACVFAFMGGTERTLVHESKIGVHQFHVPTTLHRPEAKLFTANDLAGQQLLVSLLIGYMKKMDVDPSLLKIALSVPPSGPIYYLNSQEIEQTNLVNVRWKSESWTIEPYKKGAILYSRFHYGPAFGATITFYCRRKKQSEMLMLLSFDASLFHDAINFNAVDGIEITSAAYDNASNDTLPPTSLRVDENGTEFVEVDVTDRLARLIETEHKIVVSAPMVFHRFYPGVPLLVGIPVHLAGHSAHVALIQSNCI